MTTQPPPESGGQRQPPERGPAHHYPPPPPRYTPAPPPQMPYQPPVYQGQAYGTPAGYPVQPNIAPTGAVTKPSAYWPLSIIAILCSLIFGLIGLYFSAQVGTRWASGDVQGAKKASSTALIVDVIGIVVGLCLVVALSSSGS